MSHLKNKKKTQSCKKNDAGGMKEKGRAGLEGYWLSLKKGAYGWLGPRSIKEISMKARAILLLDKCKGTIRTEAGGITASLDNESLSPKVKSCERRKGKRERFLILMI